MSHPVTEPRPRFYFVPEVAKELRRSEGATRWLIHSGALKSSKLAGRRVVTQAQLDEFFASAFEEAS
ncbi:helix-turn-helix domain-containing protein [Microbacterium marinilacus]|uniref:Helix-turn-helix domain-containing protein n=1 Tax=Microbacterium marinilacus TaxID=415209 RepID=A0ABP7BC34_9MICO|nr:helix-turn-helix domain-containing protein [Microbacterium marinilacus]MBY0687012.1 helix-turn-helix domain-containing protein [Microbacterium marinilacus]